MKTNRQPLHRVMEISGRTIISIDRTPGQSLCSFAVLLRNGGEIKAGRFPSNYGKFRRQRYLVRRKTFPLRCRGNLHCRETRRHARAFYLFDETSKMMLDSISREKTPALLRLKIFCLKRTGEIEGARLIQSGFMLNELFNYAHK